MIYSFCCALREVMLFYFLIILISFYHVSYCFHFYPRNYPVLLQGETSVGKTSLITYLAKTTGNQCVRINNHEHTDIQEYIGCYTADENGKLVFKDGEGICCYIGFS